MIPAEVRGVKAQGKPRLRKFDKSKKKFHLPQLVMAVARLPEPAREDKAHAAPPFPLENKSFVMDSMHFDIIEDDGMTTTLEPLWVSIRNTNVQINLQDRFEGIAKDIEQIEQIAAKHPDLAVAIKAHSDEIMKGKNSTVIRKAADRIVDIQAAIFGKTNIGSAVKLEEYSEKPETDVEAEIVGKEGRLLTRIHVYKERDRNFSLMVKKFYKDKNGGKLNCQACGLDPINLYGTDGERCIEAHHTIPIEELQPDSDVRVHEMAVVCASCHRVIHAKKPCLLVADVVKHA
jgi:predicted HNH restriction endonuclease